MKKEKFQVFKVIAVVIGISVLFGISSCDNGTVTSGLEDIQISVNFDGSNRNLSRAEGELLSYTPTAYSIGIKKATLMGEGSTEDFILFENDLLSDSESFSFISGTNNTKSLLTSGNTIPLGTYQSLDIELYYLQMTIDVYLSGETVPVDRTLRIYFSDDAEYEQGLHQPGDVTEINSEGIETGWLMGNSGADFTGTSPRVDAYKDGVWFDFAGKTAEDFGPFGDPAFWTDSEQPIFKTSVSFCLDLSNARAILVDFDVVDTWNCDDLTGDGVFNPDDIGGAWHMNIPTMTASNIN